MFKQIVFAAAGLTLVAAPVVAQRKPAAENRRAEKLLNVTVSGRGRIGVVVDVRPGPNDSIGATVQGVTPGGPAAKAGLVVGDIITRFNGTSLVGGAPRSSDDDQGSQPGLKLVELASKLSPGDTASLEYRRGKDRKTVQLVAADLGGFVTYSFSGDDSAGPFVFREAPGGAFKYRVDLPEPTDLARMGPGPFRMPFQVTRDKVYLRIGSPLGDMEFAPINPDLGRYFGVTDGVLVLSVPDSAALALKAGDVILSVDGRKPANVDQLLRILQSYENGESLKLDVMRDHKRVTVAGKADWDRPFWPTPSFNTDDGGE